MADERTYTKEEVTELLRRQAADGGRAPDEFLTLVDSLLKCRLGEADEISLTRLDSVAGYLDWQRDTKALLERKRAWLHLEKWEDRARVIPGLLRKALTKFPRAQGVVRCTEAVFLQDLQTVSEANKEALCETFYDDLWKGVQRELLGDEELVKMSLRSRVRQYPADVKTGKLKKFDTWRELITDFEMLIGDALNYGLTVSEDDRLDAMRRVVDVKTYSSLIREIRGAGKSVCYREVRDRLLDRGVLEQQATSKELVNKEKGNAHFLGQVRRAPVAEAAARARPIAKKMPKKKKKTATSTPCAPDQRRGGDGQSRQSGVTTLQAASCARCGLQHVRGDCKAAGQKCHTCGKIGHFKSMCRQWQRAHGKVAVNANESSDSDDEPRRLRCWLTRAELGHQDETDSEETGSEVETSSSWSSTRSNPPTSRREEVTSPALSARSEGLEDMACLVSKLSDFEVNDGSMESIKRPGADDAARRVPHSPRTMVPSSAESDYGNMGLGDFGVRPPPGSRRTGKGVPEKSRPEVTASTPLRRVHTTPTADAMRSVSLSSTDTFRPTSDRTTTVTPSRRCVPRDTMKYAKAPSRRGAQGDDSDYDLERGEDAYGEHTSEIWARSATTGGS